MVGRSGAAASLRSKMREGLAVIGGDGAVRGFGGRRRGGGEPVQVRPDHLAEAVAGQGGDANEAGRDLEAGESGAGEGAQVVVRRDSTPSRTTITATGTAPQVGIRDADHGDLADRRVVAERGLDLGGCDVLATGDDRVVGSTDDGHEPIGVDGSRGRRSGASRRGRGRLRSRRRHRGSRRRPWGRGSRSGRPRSGAGPRGVADRRIRDAPRPRPSRKGDHARGRLGQAIRRDDGPPGRDRATQQLLGDGAATEDHRGHAVGRWRVARRVEDRCRAGSRPGRRGSRRRRGRERPRSRPAARRAPGRPG